MLEAREVTMISCCPTQVSLFAKFDKGTADQMLCTWTEETELLDEVSLTPLPPSIVSSSVISNYFDHPRSPTLITPLYLYQGNYERWVSLTQEDEERCRLRLHLRMEQLRRLDDVSRIVAFPPFSDLIL